MFRTLFLSLISASALAGSVAALEVNVVLDGGDDALKARLENASRLAAADETGTATSQDYAAAALAEYSIMVGVLYEEGYYGPKVNVLLDGTEAVDLDPFELPEKFSKAEVRVQTGPVFTFGKATIAPVAPQTTLPEGFATGQKAQLDVIRSTGQEVVSGWQDIGYAKADLTDQTIVADHPNKTLDVDLGVTTGPLLSFGKLVISGNRNVREERIKAIAGLPRSAVYDPDILQQAATRLRDTGAFRSVSMRLADEISEDDKINVELRVSEAKPRRFGFGAELISQEGLELSGFWMHRNILGGAEKLRLDFSVGGIGGVTGGEDTMLKTRFERPATFDARNTLFAQTLLERQNEPDYISDQFRADLGITRWASEYLDVEYGIAYRRARIIDGGSESYFSQLLFPINATYDKREGGASATGGYYLKGEVMPFIGLNDTASGTRSTMDARTYLSLGESTVVALRGQLGAIEGAKVQNLPADFQFYSGGGGTVRGQRYRSLGYGDGGGATFLGASAEVRQGFGGSLGAVAFVDYGYIGAEPSVTMDGSDHAGGGLGLRYETPIGPLRLDVATPLSGDSVFGKLEIYIGIGQAF